MNIFIFINVLVAASLLIVECNIIIASDNFDILDRQSSTLGYDQYIEINWFLQHPETLRAASKPDQATMELNLHINAVYEHVSSQFAVGEGSTV